MDHDKAARRALLVAKALKHHASVIHNPASIMGNPPPPVARYGMMAPHLAQIAPVARAEGGEVGDRNARAASLGFTNDLFHATRSTEPFDKFQMKAGRQAHDLPGVHLGTLQAAEDRAKKYFGVKDWEKQKSFPTGDQERPSIMPLKVKLEKPFLNKNGTPFTESQLRSKVKKFGKDNNLKGIYDPQIQYAKMLRESGYDHVPYINSIEDPGSVSILHLKGQNIRSAFADFDPDRSSENNLMAANGGAIEGSDPAFTDADETAQMKYIQDPNLAMPANQVDQDIEGGAYADGGEVGQQTQVSPEQRAENLKKFNPLADKNGNPKILYHGTTGDFSKFSNAMAGSSTGAKSASFGHWFTDNPRVAQSYADYAATYAPVQKLLSMADAASRKGNWDTHDKYSLEAEKLDESFGDISNRQRGQNILPVHLSIKNPHVVDAQGGQFGDLEGGLTKHIQYAKAKGHDGLIVRNLNDAAGISNLPADHYMVFHPNQIKSATGNNGNFDPAEHDIRRADGGEVPSHPALGIPGVHIRTAEVGEPIFHGEK